LSGSSSFTRVVGVGSVYHTLRKTWVLGLHGRAGTMAPFGRVHIFEPGIDPRVARVPTEERFKLGGTSTLRGYGEGKLPVTLEGDTAYVPTGGLALAQANVELRVPLIGPFGAELFADAGNVWARTSY